MSLLQRIQVVSKAFGAANVPLDEALCEFVVDYIGSVLAETDLAGQKRAGVRFYSLAEEATEAAIDVLSCACNVTLEKLQGGLLRDIVHGLACLLVGPPHGTSGAAGPTSANGASGAGKGKGVTTAAAGAGASAQAKAATPREQKETKAASKQAPAQQQQQQKSASAAASRNTSGIIAASLSSLLSSAAAAAAREDDAVDRELAKLTARATMRSGAASTSAVTTASPEGEDEDEYKQSEEFKQLKKELEQKYSFVRDNRNVTYKPKVTYHELPKTRYFDNKVVSTKGERYIYIQDPKQAEMEARLEQLAPKKGPLKIIHTKRAGGKGHKYL